MTQTSVNLWDKAYYQRNGNSNNTLKTEALTAILLPIHVKEAFDTLPDAPLSLDDMYPDVEKVASLPQISTPEDLTQVVNLVGVKLAGMRQRHLLTGPLRLSAAEERYKVEKKSNAIMGYGAISNPTNNPLGAQSQVTGTMGTAPPQMAGVGGTGLDSPTDPGTPAMNETGLDGVTPGQNLLGPQGSQNSTATNPIGMHSGLGAKPGIGSTMGNAAIGTSNSPGGGSLKLSACLAQQFAHYSSYDINVVKVAKDDSKFDPDQFSDDTPMDNPSYFSELGELIAKDVTPVDIYSGKHDKPPKNTEKWLLDIADMSTKATCKIIDSALAMLAMMGEDGVSDADGIEELPEKRREEYTSQISKLVEGQANILGGGLDMAWRSATERAKEKQPQVSAQPLYSSKKGSSLGSAAVERLVNITTGDINVAEKLAGDELAAAVVRKAKVDKRYEKTTTNGAKTRAKTNVEQAEKNAIDNPINPEELGGIMSQQNKMVEGLNKRLAAKGETRRAAPRVPAAASYGGVDRNAFDPSLGKYFDATTKEIAVPGPNGLQYLTPGAKAYTPQKTQMEALQGAGGGLLDPPDVPVSGGPGKSTFQLQKQSSILQKLGLEKLAGPTDPAMMGTGTPQPTAQPQAAGVTQPTAAPAPTPAAGAETPAAKNRRFIQQSQSNRAQQPPQGWALGTSGPANSGPGVPAAGGNSPQ